MLNRLLFHGLIMPLSRLPLSVLYRLSDLAYLVIYYIVRMRRGVVRSNLANSFPKKSEAERLQIERKFYRHFCDLMAESLRMFSMPEEEGIRRCRCKNPELLDQYHEAGRSVLIIAGHYNNWEIAAVMLPPQSRHVPIGIYAPQRDPYFDEKLKRSRSQFGMRMVPTREISAYLEQHQHELLSVLFGGDQSPTFSKHVHWMEFLNQDTAVALGVERFAHRYNYPVIFGHITKLKRGYYEFEFELLYDQPQQTQPGEITERHTRVLEEVIRREPAYWLWSHKRWKRQRTAVEQ